MSTQKPSEMDIHFKDGVLRCKYCKKTERTKWPATLADFMGNGAIERAMQRFINEHRLCAMIHRSKTGGPV